jgi:hypothetical protein
MRTLVAILIAGVFVQLLVLTMEAGALGGRSGGSRTKSAVTVAESDWNRGFRYGARTNWEPSEGDEAAPSASAAPSRYFFSTREASAHYLKIPADRA